MKKKVKAKSKYTFTKTGFRKWISNRPKTSIPGDTEYCVVANFLKAMGAKKVSVDTDTCETSNGEEKSFDTPKWVIEIIHQFDSLPGAPERVTPAQLKKIFL